MKKTALILAILLLCSSMVFIGCRAKEESGFAAENPRPNSWSGLVDNLGSDFENKAPSESGQDPIGDGDSANANRDVFAGRKVIKNAEITMETLEFESCIKALVDKALALGGYVQTNNVYSRGYRYGDLRAAHTVVRIPADKLDEYLAVIDGSGNILSKFENVDDVTDNYVDIEARLSSLRTEYDTLLELLSKAETLEDVITLQDRLSSVRYEIESFEARKRAYDGLIEYSTVKMEISEVERESAAASESFGDEVSRRFRESLEDVGDGFRSFGAWLFGEFPRILMWLIFAVALPVVIIVIIVKSAKKSRAKRKAKKELKEAEEAAKRRAAYEATLEAEKAKLE